MRPLRVVVTGSECTGKTTLARALAERFGAPWVPEFCRGWQDAKGRPLEAEDVEPIARGQVAEADAAEAAARDVVVLDTDLLSTAVYARHYYGSCPAWIEKAARTRLAAFSSVTVRPGMTSSSALRGIQPDAARQDERRRPRH